MTALSETRTYNQTCSVARALNVLGDRWSLLIIRELLIEPRRYMDLMRNLHGISPKMLAARLKQLLQHDIVKKTTLPGPPQFEAYTLSERGLELEEVILSFVRWGTQFAPEPGPDAYISPEWTVLAMRALFQPEKAGDLEVTCQFRIGEINFVAAIKDGQLATMLGKTPFPDATIACDAHTFQKLDRDMGTLEQFIRSGELVVMGSMEKFLALASCFDPTT